MGDKRVFALLAVQGSECSGLLNYDVVPVESFGDFAAQLLWGHRRENHNAGPIFKEAYGRSLNAGNSHPLVGSFFEDLLNRLFVHKASFPKVAGAIRGTTGKTTKGNYNDDNKQGN